MFAELSKPEELMVIVVTLLAYGCPRQAIVQALDLDERTVARWQQRAGVHCHPVHEDQMMRARLDLGHVQADEIRRLTQRGAFAASFGMQGNIILAEPDALIGFAGPRVIEQFIHQKLPADADTSELLLHHGMIEAIIPRSELRTTLLLPLLLSL